MHNQSDVVFKISFCCIFSWFAIRLGQHRLFLFSWIISTTNQRASKNWFTELPWTAKRSSPCEEALKTELLTYVRTFMVFADLNCTDFIAWQLRSSGVFRLDIFRHFLPKYICFELINLLIFCTKYSSRRHWAGFHFFNSIPPSQDIEAKNFFLAP